MRVPLQTLPDYLAPGLKLVFVGINPGLYSAARGHYFARPANRFWPAFSRSRLSEPVRTALGRNDLHPEDDAVLLSFGIGFTDVVKRPSRSVDELTAADYLAWAPKLLGDLKTFQPGVACFLGVTAYRIFARYALGAAENRSILGPQERQVGVTRLFVIPSPSPRNARFRLDDLVAWYDRLAGFLEAPTRP